MIRPDPDNWRLAMSNDKKCPTLRLVHKQDALDLIADLRSALKRSERNGGEYGVYRKDGDGKMVLAVEVQV